MRLAGNAEDLRPCRRIQCAGADALAVPDVQLQFRAIPQDAREISPSEIPRPRPDMVGAYRPESPRPNDDVSERSGDARWLDRSLLDGLSEHVRRSLRRFRAQRADAR